MYIMVGTAGLFPVGRMLASNSQQTVPSMLNLIPHNSTLFNNWRVSRSGRIRRYLGPCSQTPLDMGNYTQGYGRNGFTSHGSVSSASGTDETGLHSLIQDLDMPEIDADLSDRQSEQGALFGDDSVPVTFKNDGYALAALEDSVAIIDKSHWGRLRLTGTDRMIFLNGQSTAEVVNLAPGTGRDTVLVTAQARCIDLVTVYAQEQGALLITSPGMATTVTERLQRYIFPADDVRIDDLSRRTAMFSLIGPQSDDLMSSLLPKPLLRAPVGTHAVFGFGGKPVVVAVGGGLVGRGYTMIIEESGAADLWEALVAKGAVPMGTRAWEIARVIAGRPVPGAELTNAYLPLEAGLYSAVSLNKGCYIGQETLSKVHRQGALRQELFGLELSAPAAVGDEVWVEKANPGMKPLGKVTSYVDTVQLKHRALAYLRCRGANGKKSIMEGAVVMVRGMQAKVVGLPFASRSFPEENLPPESRDEQVKIGLANQEDEVAGNRRAEKLEAMKKQLAAWQAQQEGSQ